MTPPNWVDYPDRVRATHWHELFDLGDERRKLTWKGLFSNVDKTVNFYSSRDEVVANGNGKWKNPVSREFAWYNQDMCKGSPIVSFSQQAGWSINGYYCRLVGWGISATLVPWSPEEASAIPSEALKAQPFFNGFRDVEVQGVGGSEFLATHTPVLWYAYSHGIPVESFAAGANPVPKWGERNVDMATQCVPKGRNELPWIHSYFISNSLFDTTALFERLVDIIGTTKPKEDEE